MLVRVKANYINVRSKNGDEHLKQFYFWTYVQDTKSLVSTKMKYPRFIFTGNQYFTLSKIVNRKKQKLKKLYVLFYSIYKLTPQTNERSKKFVVKQAAASLLRS
jgi:hypothetical protein